MNHKKLIYKIVKYLNFLFGILMLVVLSLYIENFFHNKKHNFESDYKIGNETGKNFMTACSKCRSASQSFINTLSGKKYFSENLSRLF
jgi:hypothetical protein